MNADTKSSLLNHIAEFQKLDFAAAFAAWKPEQPDLGAVQLANYTGTTFNQLSNRFTESLEAALGKASWHVIPNVLTGHHEWGQVDLLNMYSNHISHIQSNNIDAAAGNLDRLIWHAMTSGYWLDEQARKPVSSAQTKSIADDLATSSKRIQLQIEQVRGATEELAARRQDLVAFTEEKKNELADIRRGLDEATKQLNELQSIVQQATAKSGEVTTLKDGSQELLNELNVQLGLITKSFETFKTDSDALKTDLTTNAANSKATLDKAEEKYKEILGHKNTIERLVGMAADGHLGNKHEDRASKIQNGLEFWRAAVPVSVVLSIAWVVVVFTCLPAHLPNEWVNLGVNLLKTVPAFILLGFVFGQYSKERNLQEEYSFKAAVAMTINAYAELLSDKDGEMNKSRQQMIMNALKQVHIPPRLYADKGGSLFSLKAKELRETLATLNESIQGLGSR